MHNGLRKMSYNMLISVIVMRRSMKLVERPVSELSCVMLIPTSKPLMHARMSARQARPMISISSMYRKYSAVSALKDAAYERSKASRKTLAICDPHARPVDNPVDCLKCFLTPFTQ